MRRNGCSGLAETAMRMTRSGVVARLSDHAGPDRVGFDTAAAGQAAAIRIDQR